MVYAVLNITVEIVKYQKYISGLVHKFVIEEPKKDH